MSKNMALNGMIHSKYKNETEMASALGWTRQRLNIITNGKKMPDLDEAVKIAGALDQPLDTIANIFLGEKSPMVIDRAK